MFVLTGGFGSVFPLVLLRRLRATNITAEIAKASAPMDVIGVNTKVHNSGFSAWSAVIVVRGA